MTKTTNETHTQSFPLESSYGMCVTERGRLQTGQFWDYFGWTGSLSWAVISWESQLEPNCRRLVVVPGPVSGGRNKGRLKVNPPDARIENTTLYYFGLLKWCPLPLNMEEHEKRGPESLCPGSLCGLPLTFHGVHDVALLEFGQSGFLHHYCKIKHFCKTSWVFISPTEI